ncbi:hypothetical protein ACFL0M_14455 [Thermodesulfobacteriota bacterium]
MKPLYFFLQKAGSCGPNKDAIFTSVQKQFIPRMFTHARISLNGVKDCDPVPRFLAQKDFPEGCRGTRCNIPKTYFRRKLAWTKGERWNLPIGDHADHQRDQRWCSSLHERTAMNGLGRKLRQACLLHPTSVPFRLFHDGIAPPLKPWGRLLGDSIEPRNYNLKMGGKNDRRQNGFYRRHIRSAPGP